MEVSDHGRPLVRDTREIRQMARTRRMVQGMLVEADRDWERQAVVCVRRELDEGLKHVGVAAAEARGLYLFHGRRASAATLDQLVRSARMAIEGARTLTEEI
jgi:hypothetical protein